MENDSKLLQTLIQENTELAHLVNEHRMLDQRIAKIEKRHNLNTKDDLTRRALKKQKLCDRDRIATILSDYRKKIYDQAQHSSKAG